MWLSSQLDHEVLTYPWGVAIGASCVGAMFDVTSHRIPNWLTGLTLAGGLLFSTAMGSLTGFTESILATVLLALPYVVLFLFAGGGAGDAKMMGAIGSWLGLAHGAVALACVAIVGGIIGLGMSFAGKQRHAVLANLYLMVQGVFSFIGHRNWSYTRSLMPATDTMHWMPYGVSIFVGVCIAAIVV